MFLPGGCLCLGVSLSKGVSVQGRGLCQGDPWDRDPPPDGVKSGWYASYWKTIFGFAFEDSYKD